MVGKSTRPKTPDCPERAETTALRHGLYTVGCDRRAADCAFCSCGLTSGFGLELRINLSSPLGHATTLFQIGIAHAAPNLSQKLLRTFSIGLSVENENGVTWCKAIIVR
jgi:hypothetical protein